MGLILVGLWCFQAAKIIAITQTVWKPADWPGKQQWSDFLTNRYTVEALGFGPP